MVEYIVAIDVTRVRFPADAFLETGYRITGKSTGKGSATGTRTRVFRVRAEHPNQLDYGGAVHQRGTDHFKET